MVDKLVSKDESKVRILDNMLTNILKGEFKHKLSSKPEFHINLLEKLK